MNAPRAPVARPADDKRLWSPSAMDAVPAAIPPLDPVAQLLAEERHESSLMRLVLCAALSVGLLALAGGLLS
jgi:hypothetical protein